MNAATIYHDWTEGLYSNHQALRMLKEIGTKAALTVMKQIERLSVEYDIPEEF